MNPRKITSSEATPAGSGIGTLREKSLHAALKAWYAQPGDQLEAPVDGYMIDIVRGDLLIEIQTRNFFAMKAKLAVLTSNHTVHLVHPIAAEKWIVRLAESGEPLGRRKSPRRGRTDHLFTELVRFPGLMAHPNFTLEVLLVQEEETRIQDGKGAWRRKGWSIADRRLVGVIERLELRSPEDFRLFLPPGLPRPFTARDLAQARGIPAYLAGKMIYCLRVMGLVEITGRRGRSYLYQETTA
jgi:hypothetical protein